MPWPANPLIYEINTWTWLHALSYSYNRNVTLASIPAAEYDASLIRISPAPACEASRAVMLTLSPRAVKSAVLSSLPTTPTYAGPV